MLLLVVQGCLWMGLLQVQNRARTLTTAVLEKKKKKNLVLVTFWWDLMGGVPGGGAQFWFCVFARPESAYIRLATPTPPGNFQDLQTRLNSSHKLRKRQATMVCCLTDSWCLLWSYQMWCGAGFRRVDIADGQVMNTMVAHPQGRGYCLTDSLRLLWSCQMWC